MKTPCTYKELTEFFEKMRAAPAVNKSTADKYLARFLEGGDLAHLTAHVLSGGAVEHKDMQGFRAYSFNDQPSKYKAVQKTITVFGVELPAPETKAPEKGERYYSIMLGVAAPVVELTWYGELHDLRRLNFGQVHLTQEAAKEWADFYTRCAKGELSQ